MKKALITGIGGFVGGYLTPHLLAKKIEVAGFVHPKHAKSTLNFQKNKIKIAKCDLLDKKQLFLNLKNDKYDYIFHLAAFSSPAESFKNATQTLKNNIFSELNLLETLTKLRSKARILIVGSSEEYGNVKSSDLPVKEEIPLAPVSPYAVSKVAQDLLGYQFYLHHSLKIVRVRPFNHIGPGQSTNFVVPNFASQIAKLEKKGGDQIKVGNLNSWRDFTDVRDIVVAYLLALEKGQMGDVYNIGSGKMRKIDDILDRLISFSKVKIKIIRDKKLFRQSEIKKIYCDYSKFKKQTGWMPKIDITKSLLDTIEYERKLN